MKGQVLVVRPDGWDTAEVEQPITLQTMYELIDCKYVQSIDTPINDVEMVMDKEAKFSDPHVGNPWATRLVKSWLGPGDYVAGATVLCTHTPDGHWIGLNEAQLQTVLDELKEQRRGGVFA